MDLNRGISTPIAILIVIMVAIVAAGAVWQYREIEEFDFSTEPSEVMITLERGGCYGTCPIYELKIHGDGSVIYKGEKHVNATGTRKTKISQAKVKNLVDEFYNVDYFSLKDSYEEPMATDRTTVVTSITVDDKTKTIRHYHGDMSAPEELGKLEDKIDQVVGTDRWIESESTSKQPSDYTTQADCESVGYYWYDDACHEEEQIQPTTEQPGDYTTQAACKDAGYYWYDDGCYSEKCVDSDGGENYYEKGVTHGTMCAQGAMTRDWEDECQSDKTLEEYYCVEPYEVQGPTAGPCTANVKSTTYECSNGCENGACIEEEQSSEEKSITVTFPNGGEEWELGETYKIKWSADNLDKVNIAYHLEGGGGDTIAKKVNASSGEYSWEITENVFPGPEYSNLTAKISVSSLDFVPAMQEGVRDKSDESLTITREK